MKYVTIIASLLALALSSVSFYSVFAKKSEPVTDDVSYGVYTMTDDDTTAQSEVIKVTDFVSEEETEEIITKPLTVEEKEITFSSTNKAVKTTTTKASNGKLFHITVYVPSKRWGKLTASGETAVHLKTCATDPTVIPMGSTVKVNGLTLRANDTGSAVKGNCVDIFYDGTESEAIAWMSEFGDYHTVEVM